LLILINSRELIIYPRREGSVETKSKKFYFQEMDWVISFPSTGNEGRKYLFYTVQFIDRRNRQIKPRAILEDVVVSPMFENGYPHTVAFFRDSVDKECNFEANYLELRIISCLEEFWKFLNDLNL
jgi:hypothetical protein